MNQTAVQMVGNSKDELFLIDGSGFIFRAYFAMAYSGRGELTNPAGVPVSAVMGYTNMLMKLLREHPDPQIVVVFDAKGKTFRNDICPEYKANRDAPPEDLIPQFPLVRDATRAFDIQSIELEGYEADDLIAAYTKLASAAGRRVTIVSSDKDLMQLINDTVCMLDPMKNKWIGAQEVQEKFGVAPNRVIDVQSLAGDGADNIPGVPGIGIKTAALLINEFGDLDTLLERASEIKQNKRRENLIEFAEQARVSRKLVTLDQDMPVPVALEDFLPRPEKHPNLMPFLQEHGFNSIIKRLGGAPVSAPPSPANAEFANTSEANTPEIELPPIADNEYTLITDGKALQEWIAAAKACGELAIDTETTSLTPAKAKLVGISICSEVGKAAYIPLNHVAGEVDLFGESIGGSSDLVQMDFDEAIKLLKPLLEDPSVIKIGHNMKYDWQLFAREGIHMTPCDDTMLLSYVLDGTAHSHSMDNLCVQYFDHQPIKFEEVAGKGKKQVTFDHVKIEDALTYAAEDADVTLRFYKIFKPRLVREKMTFVYEDIERPLIPVIAQMELSGIKIDHAFLQKLSSEFGKRLMILEGEIHDLAGNTFNIASPKQVGEVLFNQMGLQGGKKTKTGDWSTSVSVLEKLSLEGHEIVQKILDYRQMAKLKSTYTDALQEQINPATGRVHTSYSMAYVNTGRLSSSDPNLQNIPIRTEEGRKIRKAFIADAGHTLLSVDYSQVELRLAAELAGIEALKQAFHDGVDIHTLTASQVFDVPLDQVTPELRRQAKAVNFGIIYGISGWGLAKQLGCGPGEATEFIRRYLHKFAELNDYMEERKQEARDNGFIRTHYGRKCVIRGINDKNGAVRSGAERQAINAPLQGTAADIMKIAMGKMPRALKDAKLSAKMLLQVHDELIFEVPHGELEKTSDLVREIMESAFKISGFNISVPLEAEAGSGSNWAQAH